MAKATMPFAAPGEAELLAGGRLHADTRRRDAGDLGDARAHGVAVRADPRRLADDRDIEMRDASAARLHALDRKVEEAVRGGAAPLRIARRKVHADVAVGERAEDRVDQRMQHDVGVGMARDAARMRRCARRRARHDRRRQTDARRSRSRCARRRARRAGSPLRAKILRRWSVFTLRCLAFEDRNLEPGPFGERGIVGEILAARGRARRCASSRAVKSKACGVCTMRSAARSIVAGDDVRWRPRSSPCR